MARKDAEKEVERPHYYSQFWLDVAAGRRVISAGKGSQDAEETEVSELESAPEALARGGKITRGSTSAMDDVEVPVQRAAPAAPETTRVSSSKSLADLAEAVGMVDVSEEEAVPDLARGSVAEAETEATAPEAAVEVKAEPEEAAFGYGDLYDEEEEEEEEEGWSPRRGKKPKKPEKPRRREKGREF